MEIDDDVMDAHAESGKTVANIKKGMIMLKCSHRSQSWRAWCGHSQEHQAQQPSHLSQRLRSSAGGS